MEHIIIASTLKIIVAASTQLDLMFRTSFTIENNIEKLQKNSCNYLRILYFWGQYI